MRRRHPGPKFRPSLERFEEKCLLSHASPVLQLARHAPCLALAGRHTPLTFPSFPNPVARYLVPDNGPLTPIVEQVQVDSVRLTPGVYNVSVLTVRNGTGHAIDPRSLSVGVPGGGGSRVFPASKSWSSGGVIVFYSISTGLIGPSYTFNLGGTQVSKPTNTFANIRYLNAASFSHTLNTLITPATPGGRYRLV